MAQRLHNFPRMGSRQSHHGGTCCHASLQPVYRILEHKGGFRRRTTHLHAQQIAIRGRLRARKHICCQNVPEHRLHFRMRLIHGCHLQFVRAGHDGCCHAFISQRPNKIQNARHIFVIHPPFKAVQRIGNLRPLLRLSGKERIKSRKMTARRALRVPGRPLRYPEKEAASRRKPFEDDHHKTESVSPFACEP